MTDCSGDGCILVGAREDGVSVLFIRVTTSTRSTFIITEFTLLNWNIPEQSRTYPSKEKICNHPIPKARVHERAAGVGCSRWTMGLPFSIMSLQVAGVIHIVLFGYSSEVTDLKQDIELGLWAPVSQRLDINIYI